MALPGTKKEDVEKVYSHYQALAQCDEYIRKWGVERETAYDTAGSAKMLREKQMTTGASPVAALLWSAVCDLRLLCAVCVCWWSVGGRLVVVRWWRPRPSPRLDRCCVYPVGPGLRSERGRCVGGSDAAFGGVRRRSAARESWRVSHTATTPSRPFSTDACASSGANGVRSRQSSRV